MDKVRNVSTKQCFWTQTEMIKQKNYLNGKSSGVSVNDVDVRIVDVALDTKPERIKELVNAY